jgi:hypothetical protein
MQLELLARAFDIARAGVTISLTALYAQTAALL